MGYTNIRGEKMDKRDKLKLVLNAAYKDYLNAPKGKREAMDFNIKIGLADSYDAVINVYDFVEDQASVSEKNNLRIKVLLVLAKDIGLEPKEIRAISAWNRAHEEVIEWLNDHSSENKDGSPKRFKHSQALNKLLTDDALKLWRRAEGWTWSCKYGLAWTNEGVLSGAKPSKKDGRIRVLGQGLYWWLMVEWLARVKPQLAVDVIKGKYEIHHIDPTILSTHKGNALENLRVLRQQEHSHITSAARKINQWYKEKYLAN